MKESLDKLTSIAAELNRATNAANDAFRMTEAFLDAISLGLPATSRPVDVPGSVLSYRRFEPGGRFGIAIEGADDFGQFPWDQAPRRSRLRAVVSLPALLEAILAEALATQALAKDAEAAAKSVLDALKAVAPRVNPQVARTVPPFVSEGLYVPRATP